MELAGPPPINHNRAVSFAESRLWAIELILPDGDVLTDCSDTFLNGLAPQQSREEIAERLLHAEDRVAFDMFFVNRRKEECECVAHLDLCPNYGAVHEVPQPVEMDVHRPCHIGAEAFEDAEDVVMLKHAVCQERAGDFNPLALHTGRLLMVQKWKMRHIHSILRDFLDVCANLIPSRESERQPGRVVILRHFRRLPGRLGALLVVVDHDQAVDFFDRPTAEGRVGRNLLRIRNDIALAFSVPPPSVEGALYGVPYDATAVTKMRAEVRAMGFEHARRAVLSAEQHQVAPEITQRPDLPGFDFTADSDLEPAARIWREREPRTHKLYSAQNASQHKGAKGRSVRHRN